MRSRSVAIAHDYLNQFGGAERVALELASIWPQAPIYTSLYRPGSTFREFRDHDVRTSFLDRLPIDGGFRDVAPLYPAAFSSFGELDYDVVISSSSGWAHGVHTAPRTTHVIYFHAPARWLYSPETYLGRGSHRQQLLNVVSPALRRWDRRAVLRADGYITIARNVRERLKAAFGIDAAVVHPPVDVKRFRPRPRGERLLVVSRLLPYKRIDLIVDAATRAGIALDVVGEGPSMDDLRARAGPTVEFHGRVAEDEALVHLFESARAVCVPGIEDFGLIPVEANAAGKPAIAFAARGALETVQDNVTGALFAEPTVDAVLDAVRRADAISASPEELSVAAQRFSADRFRAELTTAITEIEVDRAWRGRTKVRRLHEPAARAA
jgi:glycosyltransferase involved in cell wall biosynthesis